MKSPKEISTREVSLLSLAIELSKLWGQKLDETSCLCSYTTKDNVECTTFLFRKSGCKYELQLFSNSCMCGVKESNRAGVQLNNQALFGVYSNTIAGKFGAIEDERYSVA